MLQVLQEVQAERERQEQTWGRQDHADPIWLAVLTEEVGEAAQGVLHEMFGGTAKARPELVQVAAVVVAWIECIDRRESV